MVPATVPVSEPKEPASWHYALIDDQIKVEAKSHAKYTHVVRRLTTAQGLNDGAQFSIYFNPKYEKLTIHDVVIIRQDTKVDVLKRENIRLLQREERLENNVYDGWVTANVLIPGVRKDDTLSYRYTISGSNPVFEGLFAYNYAVSRNPNPNSRQSLRLIYPKERKIAYKAHDPSLSIKEVVGPINKEVTLVVDNLPSATQSTDLPPSEYLRQLVQFSEFDGWSAVDVWASKLFNTEAPMSRALLDRVQGWKSAGGTTDDQTKAALNFIQKDIRYFSVSLGESSHKPNSPEVVLNNRYGDCKDKSLLLAASFKALGVSAQPVLVNSWLGDAVTNMLPSPLAFDHAIVSAEINGTEIWLDPTRNFATGPIKSRAVSSYKKGLKVSGKTSDLAPNPQGIKKEPVIEVIDTFTIGNFGQPANINTSLHYKDDFAEKLSVIWSSPQRAALEKELILEYSRRYPSFIQSGAVELISDSDQNSVKVKVQGTVSDFFGYPSQEYLSINLFTWAISNELRAGIDTARKTPFYLGPERSISHTVRVLFPEAVSKQPINSNRTVRGNHFYFDSTLVGGTNSIELTNKVDFSKPAVAVQEWNEFSSKARETLNLTLRDLSISAIVPDKVAPLQDAIRKELRENERQIVTEIQARQRVRRLVLTEHINGNRLTVKHKNQALMERAIAHNLLGETSNAMKDAQAAIAGIPDNGEYLNEYVQMQWAAGKFADALETIEKIKKQGFQNSSVEQEVMYSEGRVRFYLGEYDKAAALFDKVAGSANGDLAVFAAIWMDLAKGRAGIKFSDAMTAKLSNGFPLDIYKYLRGETDADELMKKAQASDNKGKVTSNKCEANFFIGMKLLQSGDKSQARKYFQAALDTKVTEYIEFKAAAFELTKF